jgi:hypothetical protein
MNVTGIIFLIVAVLTAFTGVSMMKSSAQPASTHSEKGSDDFVLSEETPISTGHGFAGTSASTEPVDILSYGVHFRIPRNHIDAALHNVRDRTMDFSLLALYPDLIGADVSRGEGRVTEREKVWISGSSPNLITIYTVGGEIGGNTKHDFNRSVFDKEANEPDHPWKFGLLQSLKESSAFSDIYFQRPDKDGPGYVVSYLHGKGTTEWCEVEIRVSPKLLMLYRFSPSLLPHWQDIHQKVERLIQSFIVKGDR